MADLAENFNNLKSRINSLEAGLLLHDYFIVNGQQIHLDITRNMSEVAGPFCVEAGQTMFLDFSVTLEELEDTILGFVLIKEHQEPVAIARLKDSKGPSSLSLLYRETAADDDLTYSLFFVIDETKDPIYPEHKNHWQAYFNPKPIFPEYAISPENIQLGIKIFGEGLLPVSDTISDPCPVVAIPCG